LPKYSLVSESFYTSIEYVTNMSRMLEGRSTKSETETAIGILVGRGLLLSLSVQIRLLGGR